MSDDKLLDAVGREAAHQEREGERWQALGAEQGRAVPAGDAGATDTDDEVARRLFAPPSEAFVEQMAGSVLGLLADEAKGASKKTNVVPWGRRTARWAGLAFAPIAAAAAIALFVSRAGAPLPGYTLTVSGGLRDSRGAETRAPAESLSVAPGTEVVLLARPDARASEGVHAATFLLRSGVTVPVRSASEVSEKGALRVTVPGDEIVRAAAGTAAPLDLVLVVGLSSGLDRHAPASSEDDAKTPRDWARFSVPVRIQAPGR